MNEVANTYNTFMAAVAGAGKTTIVNLLCRFYEISSGSILIDGIDIRG
jgi:ABC-type multidrug transport system fused ATPase/permease subunit